MPRFTSFTWQITALTLLTLGLGLLLLPEDFSSPVRQSLRDVARPGQTVTLLLADQCASVWHAFQDWQARRSDLEILKSKLKDEQQLTAEMRKQLSQLQHKLLESDRKWAAKALANPSESLFTPQLIDARVLGHEIVNLHQGRKILGVGTTTGAGENLLVLDPQHPTLDIGQDLGTTVHAPVFSDQIVVGRTINCGAYSCSLQPITDIKFSGAGQVMRRTASGLQPGPEGVVEGTGKKTCLLTGVWRREPVEVGDEIYTPADDPLLPCQMYYGKVVRAELSEGAAHWHIELEPAGNKSRLTHVQVLRPQDNPLRIVTN